MTKLTLPIPSPVPFDVLTMSIDSLLDRVPTERRYSSAIVTRLANVCQNRGIETVWMLATYTRQRLRCIKGCGPRVASLAEAVLQGVGCALGSFSELHDALGLMREILGRRWCDPGFSEVLMALAGIGDWGKDPTIIAALAEHGLRPDMPLEELFAHGSQEPKKLTVTEELLAFGALQAADVLPAESMEGLPSDTTMIEVMTILSASEDWFGYGPLARDRFVRAARERLSSEALTRLNISNE